MNGASKGTCFIMLKNWIFSFNIKIWFFGYNHFFMGLLLLFFWQSFYLRHWHVFIFHQWTTSFMYTIKSEQCYAHNSENNRIRTLWCARIYMHQTVLNAFVYVRCCVLKLYAINLQEWWELIPSLVLDSFKWKLPQQSKNLIPFSRYSQFDA